MDYKHKCTKFLGANIGECLFDLEFSKDFIDLTLKALFLNEKIELIEIRNF